LKKWENLMWYPSTQFCIEILPINKYSETMLLHHELEIVSYTSNFDEGPEEVYFIFKSRSTR
jgi:hypothetical protein